MAGRLEMEPIKPLATADNREQCAKEDNPCASEISSMECDSEPTCHKAAILPPLSTSRELKLISWFTTSGLMLNSRKCDRIVDGVYCQGPMFCTPVKVADFYQWQCSECLGNLVRPAPTLQDIQCHLQSAMCILVGWCRCTDADTMAKFLCIKRRVVDVVYNVAAGVADKYIRSNLNRWKIGGPGVIVIIDTYPEGLSKLGVQESNMIYNRPILCLAEAKEIPTRFWFQMLDQFCSQSSEQVLQSINETALRVIQEMVKPGSVLVTNQNSQICSYDVLQSLKHLYQVIITVEGLKRHDHMNQLLKDLETIWEPAVKVCREAQTSDRYSQTQHIFTNVLWKQEFCNESFKTLVNQFHGNLL